MAGPWHPFFISASAPPDHPAGGLAAEESPLQIYSDCQIVVRLAYMLRWIFGRYAGVVHQDVEPSKVGHRVIHGSRNLVEPRHVHLQRQRAPAQCLDFRGHAAVRVAIAESQRDVRACRGQRQGDGPAQSAGRAGYERDLAGKIKRRIGVQRFLP